MCRDRIMADTGKPVAVVYGSLPSEVRRREAGRFASGAAPFLTATDAIGQGLNLPIRRVLFTALHKFNGDSVVALPATDIHQIAGRAGRFGFHETGYVGVLKPCEAGALRTLSEALATPPTPPPGFRPTIGLSAWHIRTIADRLQLTSLADCVEVWSNRLALMGESPFDCACPREPAPTARAKGGAPLPARPLPSARTSPPLTPPRALHPPPPPLPLPQSPAPPTSACWRLPCTWTRARPG